MGPDLRFFSRKARAFPGLGRVAWLTAWRPITVAGPRPICTAFPASIACKIRVRVYVGHEGVSTRAASGLGAEGKADPSPRTSRGVRDDSQWLRGSRSALSEGPAGCRRYQSGLRCGCIGGGYSQGFEFAARASAIFPVGFALFYQGAEAFLGIFEAVELVQEDVHGLFQAIAQGEAHAAEDGFFGHA